MGRGKKPKKSMSTGRKKGGSKPGSVERFREEDMDDEIDACIFSSLFSFAIVFVSSSQLLGRRAISCIPVLCLSVFHT